MTERRANPQGYEPCTARDLGAAAVDFFGLLTLAAILIGAVSIAGFAAGYIAGALTR